MFICPRKGLFGRMSRGQLSRASISPFYRQRMRDVMPRDTYVRDVGRAGGDQGPINVGMEDKFPRTGLVIERSRVRIPAGTAGEFSSPGSTFCADSYFGIRSTPVLPQ